MPISGTTSTGPEEGRKNRPSVIVLCVTRAEDDATEVTVLPDHPQPAIRPAGRRGNPSGGETTPRP